MTSILESCHMLATQLFRSKFRYSPATLVIQLVPGQEPLLLVKALLIALLLLVYIQ
jgi:hypothetical protein